MKKPNYHRYWCMVVGHRWKRLRFQPKWMLLGPQVVGGVGDDKLCTRCGYRQDFTNPNHELWGVPMDMDGNALAKLDEVQP